MSNTNLRSRERICWKCGGTFHALDVCPEDGSRLLDLNPDDLADPMIGKLFDGKYRIVRKLGEGGMGTVYAARQINFERQVALKILKADYLRDENIKRRFMYEARTISNLRHPNSVRLFDFGQAPPHDFYMVMELLEGESLADRLAYRFLTYREIFDIIPPVCGVLGEAHIADVVHRDLKPENIFLCRINGNAEASKLLDFGIAKHLTDETMTKSGTLWGTPAYMSPEQAKGDTVGAPADIYAIGVILYELISGNLPFSATTQMGLAMKHISVPARSLLSMPGLTSVPQELDDLILRTLQKDPLARPVSMDELASALEQIRTTCFDDTLLDKVPAQEIDAIALQQWILAESTVEEELPRQSGQFGAMPKAAADISAEPKVRASTTPTLQTGDFLRLNGLVDESRETIRAIRRRPWLAIAGSAIVALAFAGGIYATSSSESVPEVPPVAAVAQVTPEVDVAAPVDSSPTTSAAGDAAATAAGVVLNGRAVAASVRPRNNMIVVDSPENVTNGKRRKPTRTTKAEPKVKRALEKTF